MTFDFRSWGESDGHPRHVISVRDRIADAEAALNHLKQQPEVDPSSIVIWGSSLGGGIACTLADRHPELLGTIAQVPMLDGRAASSATPLFRRLRLLMYAFVDLLRSDKPLYIPIVSEPGQLSTMNRDGAARAKEESAKLYGPGAPNYVAARSALTMLTYRPIKSLGGIQVPTLLIGGTRDTVAPFNNRAVQKTCSPKLQIKILDVNHFEPYLPPFLEPNLSIQTEFLNNLLHS
jgi:alpha-beta hydrolase superfamily lysophospholipase